MNLVLVNAPLQDYGKVKKREYYTTPPLGLGYLATIAQNQGYSVKLIDAEAEGLSPAGIVKQTKEWSPDVVGINLTAPTLEIAKEIVQRIKNKTQATMIAGGPDATIRPEFILDYIPDLDLLVRGEGEISLEQLIKSGFNPIDINGVSFRSNNGKVTHNPPSELITDLDSLPFIDRKFFVNDPYMEDGHLKAVIMGSRGCPYTCTFCAAPVTSGRRIRTRSVENIVDEVEELNSNGVTSFQFLDNDFIYNKKRILDFADELERRNLNINWRALARVDVISRFGKEFLERIKQAGCYHLVFGIESGSKRILDLVKKGTTPEQAHEAVQLCKEVGIKTKAYYMFGFPTETVQEMELTLNHARKLDTDIACFLLVKAYPGTVMYDQLAEQYGEARLEGYSNLQTEVDLPEARNFDKYHIRNTSSISTLSNRVLVNMLRKAYKIYYPDGSRR